MFPLSQPDNLRPCFIQMFDSDDLYLQLNDVLTPLKTLLQYVRASVCVIYVVKRLSFCAQSLT